LGTFLDRILKVRLEYKFAAVAAALALMSALNYFFWVSDLQDLAATEDRTIHKLEDDLIQKQSIANNLNEYRRQKEALEHRLVEALTELPNDANIDELLTQLNEVGVKSGLRISSVEPGTEAKEGSFYSKIPVKLSMVGNFHEIASFFDAVGRLKRIVNISEIRVKTPTKDHDKVVLKVDCLATTFRFIDKPAVPEATPAGGIPAAPGIPPAPKAAP